MKASVLTPWTKAGFLFFILLQTSLMFYTSAQITSNGTSTTNTTLNATAAPMDNSTTNLSTNGTNSTMVSCPVFSCNLSACYSIFMSTNVTTCSDSEPFCELRRDGDILYSVRCTSTCLRACTNTSQINCSINCCTTNCVNSTLNSLPNSTLIMNTTTTTTTVSTTTRNSSVISTTMATNGKRCHKMSCTGENCYQGNNNVGLCAPGQNFCMLKKTSAVTVVTWTASCVESCSKETVCTSTNTNCIMECCNATTTASCLKLNGQVNIVGSGTMAPCCHVFLLVLSFFFWLLMISKPGE